MNKENIMDWMGDYSALSVGYSVVTMAFLKNVAEKSVM